MNEITIERLCELSRDLDSIEITQHIFMRFRERGIRLNDVITAIQKGEIIEYYPKDYPFPSCLVLGLDTNNRYLHTVCGVGNNKIWIITVYSPALDKWESNYKTRKAVQQ